MRRITLITLVISLVVALVIGVLVVKTGKAFSDPLSSPGTLVKAHYKLEGKVNNCGACHKSAWQGITNASCTGCHNRADFEKRTQNAKTIFHLKMDIDNQSCLKCHSEHKGFTAKIANTFDHNLLEASKSDKCESCHITEKEKHLQAKGNAYNGACVTCHVNTAWKPSAFKHMLLSDQQLYDCTSCHTKDKTVHLGKNSGNEFDSQCSNCHTIRNWKTSIFRHDALNIGDLNKCTNCHIKEAAVHQDSKGQNIYGNNCGACHQVQKWKPAEINVTSILAQDNPTCDACHAQKMPPKHIEQYGNSCSSCHQTSKWIAVSLKHNVNMTNCAQCHKKTDTVVHQNTFGQCSTCHFTARWQPMKFTHTAINKGVQCVTCHTRQAEIHAGKYGSDCALCHKVSSWVMPKFNHPQGNLNCNSCHQPLQTTNHKAVSSKCSACHSTNNWKPVRFDHLQIKGNPTCVSCHEIDNTYHEEQYMVNKNCQQCHTTLKWRPSTFSHDNLRGQSCTACHVPPDVSYHRNLGSNCEDCHSTKSWVPAKFNHEPYGPIPKGHTTTCSSCHM